MGGYVTALKKDIVDQCRLIPEWNDWALTLSKELLVHMLGNHYQLIPPSPHAHRCRGTVV